MKKFCKFLKRTLFIVLPAVFACSLSLGQLHDIKPTFADDSSSTVEDYDIENEIYTIRKTGDHSLEILFNANPRVYKNFRKHHLTELKDALMEILKDIVHTKITELSENEREKDTSGVDGTGGDKDEQPVFTPDLQPDLPEMVYPVHNYITLEPYSEMVLNYCNYLPGGTYKNLHEVTRSIVVGYAYFYVEDTIIRNGWVNDAATRASVFNDFCVICANRTFYPFNCSIREAFSQFYAAGESILDPNFAINLDHVTGMLLLIKDKDETGSSDLGVKDLLATIGGSRIKSQLDEMILNSSSSELINFFKVCPLPVIQSVMDEIDFTGADLNELLETVSVQTFIDITAEIGVEKTTDIIQHVPDFDKHEFIEKVTELTTAKDVWSAIKNIHVDGVMIMEDKIFKVNKIGKLLKKFPPLSELRNYGDSKWRHNFEIVLDTAVEEVHLDVNFGFKGNCKYLRKLAALLDDHLKITKTGDHYDIEVDVPSLLANMYRYLLESDFLDDELKHELWDMAFSTVEEAYQHVHQKTLADLMENAEQIDYKVLAESIMSADEIKEFFGISRLVTQERVDKFVDLVFKAINKGSTFNMETVYELVDDFYPIPDDLRDQIDKIYSKAAKILKKIAERNYDAEFIHDYLSSHTSEEFNEKVETKIDHFLEKAKVTKYYNRFQRLLEKVYARIPERFRNKSLMDYYKGNSVWQGEADADFQLTKWIRKIPKVGPKIADFLSSFFDKLPNYISVNAKFTGHDLYRISYHIGDEVKTGALPVDTEATFWANRKTVLDGDSLRTIVGWAEQVGEDNYNYLDLMPARDVDAYPIYFTTSASISKPYDGIEANIYVEPNITVAHPYSYVWYRDGHLLTDETGPSITVKNHSDSGTYYCVVDGVQLEEITVDIARVQVSVPQQSEDIIYDGSAHDYYTSFGETSEDNLLFYGSGDVSATEPGEYFVDLELKDVDNYEWSSPSHTYSWVVQKAEIHIDPDQLIWSEPRVFTYDGEEHEITLQENLLPAGVHVEYENNTGTNAGTYSATANIVLDDPAHYFLTGTTSSSADLVINKGVIVIPSTIALEQDTFSYDGNEHSVKITEDLLPDGITGVNYSGDKSATEAGNYTLTVSYEYDTLNYELDPNYQSEFNWKIDPRIIDISRIAWDYVSPFEYTGRVHQVSLINVPTGVKIEYTGVTKATASGTYIAHGKAYTQSSTKLLYNGVLYDTYGFDLEWTIADVPPVPTRTEFYSEETNEAGTSLVWISLSKGIVGDYVLRAEEVDQSKYNFNSLTKTGSVSVVVCYDINFYTTDGELAEINMKKGQVIDKNFKFTIRILVPDAYKEGELILAHGDDDGSVTKLEGKRQGNYMVFTTNHLSVYGLVEQHVAGSNIIPYIITSACALVAVQATGSWLLFMLAKRRRRTMKE